MLLKLLLGIVFLVICQIVCGAPPDCFKKIHIAVMVPSGCCSYPEVFKENVLNHCFTSNPESRQHFYECVFDASEICRRRNCSIDKANDYVDFAMTKNDPFNSIYKRIFEICLNEAIILREANVEEYLKETRDPIPEITHDCLQNVMIAMCPDAQFSYLDKCVKVREQLNSCFTEWEKSLI